MIWQCVHIVGQKPYKWLIFWVMLPKMVGEILVNILKSVRYNNFDEKFHQSCFLGAKLIVNNVQYIYVKKAGQES